MNIREFKSDDLHRGFFETLENLGPIENPRPEKVIRVLEAIAHKPTYNVYVAEIEGHIVGAITVLIEQKFIHDCGRAAHIEDVVVRKGFEGRGVARALVEHATRRAKTLACYKSILSCEDRLVPLYERCGYRRHGVEMRMDL